MMLISKDGSCAVRCEVVNCLQLLQTGSVWNVVAWLSINPGTMTLYAHESQEEAARILGGYAYVMEDSLKKLAQVE